jgi:tetrahydromethanopterin S-methyltransferase subunit G
MDELTFYLKDKKEKIDFTNTPILDKYMKDNSWNSWHSRIQPIERKLKLIKTKVQKRCEQADKNGN